MYDHTMGASITMFTYPLERLAGAIPLPLLPDHQQQNPLFPTPFDTEKRDSIKTLDRSRSPSAAGKVLFKKNTYSSKSEIALLTAEYTDNPSTLKGRETVQTQHVFSTSQEEICLT